MSEKNIYFQAGGTLDENAPSYIERKADHDLLTALSRQEYCLVFAPRQTGKSSLMVRTRKILSAQGVKAGIVDLQYIGSEMDPDRWFNAVLHQIQRSMDIDMDFKQWVEAQVHLSPTERFRTFIEEILQHHNYTKAVIFFDEVDSVLNLPFSDDFFTTLRSLYNARATEARLKGLAIVLLGVITAPELIQSRIRTPYNIGISILIEDFECDPETIKHLQGFLGKDSEALIQRIFYWTNGQPFLLQKLAQTTVRIPKTQMTPEGLDYEVERLFFRDKLEKDPHLRYIQNYLLNDLTSVRKTLRIYRQLLRGQTYGYSDQSYVHNRLKLSGLARVVTGKFVLRNKIYEKLFNAAWLKRHAGERKFMCIHCDTENREDVEICRNCGVKLVQRCPECGRDYGKEDRHCRNCGSNLEVYFDALEVLEGVRLLREKKKWEKIVDSYKGLESNLKLESTKGLQIKKELNNLVREAEITVNQLQELRQQIISAKNEKRYNIALDLSRESLNIDPFDKEMLGLQEELPKMIEKMGIKSEVANPQRLSSMDWLPLTSSYLRTVILTSNDLPLGIIDPMSVEKTPKKNMELNSIYIALNTKTIIQIDDEKRKNRLGSPPEKALSKPEEKTRPLTVLEAVNQERLIVILGDPGNGKSTFVNYLAISLATGMLENLEGSGDEQAGPQRDSWESVWSHGLLLPVIITLRQFASSSHCNSTAYGLWKFIESILGEKKLELFSPILKRKLINGGVMVFFDGLDEVGDVQQTKLVRAAILDFLQIYNSPKNRYLVTSRGYAYEKLQDFNDYELAPITNIQIDHFIRAWYFESKRILAQKISDETEVLIRRLQDASKRNELATLAKNPLQLTLMTSLHFTWGRLPDDRAMLYREIVSLLLVRWQEARHGTQSGISQLIRYSDLESGLEELAFHAHCHQIFEGLFSLSEEHISQVFKGCSGISKDQANKVLIFIQQRSGLLVESSSGMYTFPHRGYQEYLAGAYLVRQPDFLDLAVDLASKNFNHWKEAILWAVIILTNLKKMPHLAVNAINALCPQSLKVSNDFDSDKVRTVILAAEGLLEVGVEDKNLKERNPHTLENIRSSLLSLVETGVLSSGERVKAAELMGQIGDPRFNPDLFFLPKDPLLGFIKIPEGSFMMGSDAIEDGKPHSRGNLVRKINFSTFYLGRYPVTNLQFRHFVAKTGFKTKRKEWLQDLPNYPIRFITWFEALKYCEWLTKRLQESKNTPELIQDLLNTYPQSNPTWRISLPTEAKWERAAKGENGRTFPWGNEENPEKANYAASKLKKPTPIGCFPQGTSPSGFQEMAGNVWEWCSDRFSNFAIDSGDAVIDTTTVGTDPDRVVRGGSWSYSAWFCRSVHRFGLNPEYAYNNVGFRVVLAPVLKGEKE